MTGLHALTRIQITDLAQGQVLIGTAGAQGVCICS